MNHDLRMLGCMCVLDHMYLSESHLQWELLTSRAHELFFPFIHHSSTHFGHLNSFDSFLLLLEVFYSYTDEYYRVWAFWCKWIRLGIPIDFFPWLFPQRKELRALKVEDHSCAPGSTLGSGDTTVREKHTKSLFLQDTHYLKKYEVKKIQENLLALLNIIGKIKEDEKRE